MLRPLPPTSPFDPSHGPGLNSRELATRIEARKTLRHSTGTAFGLAWSQLRLGVNLMKARESMVLVSRNPT